MSNYKILQIGVGGSGAWFSELLMRALISSKPFLETTFIEWDIIDPDIVESKNLVRQHFLGYESIGMYKADYAYMKLSKILSGGLNYHGLESCNITINPIKDLYLPEIGSETANHLDNLIRGGRYSKVLVILAVDNTLTRSQFEQTLSAIGARQGHAETCMYLDMGNTDKEFVLVGTTPLLTPVFNYGVPTLPDQMISCADRAETTPVPQTTLMNSLVGNYASNLAAKFLINNELKYTAMRGTETEMIQFVKYRADMAKICQEMSAATAQPETPVATPVEEVDEEALF